MSAQERETFFAGLHVGVIAIADPGSFGWGIAAAGG